MVGPLPEMPRVACFATQGPGSRDEDRIKRLLAPLQPEVIAFERSGRIRTAKLLLRRIRRSDPELVVMEGTGLGGGLPLLLARELDDRPFVVSSGDAVGPFISAVSRPLGLAGGLYEAALCRQCSGFIGWSPYLVGRALTFGAPRAMCAPNWADPHDHAAGGAVRRSLGIAEDALVFGIVGSLNWTQRYEYCYGLELVKAVLRSDREDVSILIVGDGDGRERLRQLAGDRLNRGIFLPGPVPRGEVGDYLAAMDVASLPQSVDQVGAFRYTTKISEYLAAGLPIVTGQIPLAYDLDAGFLWRIPGDAPWDDRYVRAMAELMQTLPREEATRRRPEGAHSWLFDADRQAYQVSRFILDVVDRERQRRALKPRR